MKRNLYTLGGFLAVLAWASCYGIGRSLISKVGLCTGMGLAYLIAAGIVAFAVFLSEASQGRRTLGRFSLRHSLACGTFFVLFTLVLYTAIHSVVRDAQVVEVAMITKFWPTLSLLISIPILAHRARWGWVALGTVLSAVGIVTSVMIQNHLPFDFAPIWQNIQECSLPYILAAVAAVSWALYSNFSRLYASEANPYSTALFIFIAGVLFFIGRSFIPETSQWSVSAGIELLLMALFPTGLAYLLWARAMEKGNVVATMTLSYLSPLLASIFSALYLRTAIEPAFWLACLAVILGAIISKSAVREKQNQFPK